MNKRHSLSMQQGSCIAVILTSLVSLTVALAKVKAQAPAASCAPTSQIGSQAIVANDLPKTIPAGRAQQTDPDFLFGTGTFFSSVPHATSASLSLCLDDSRPQNLKITVTPLGAPSPAPQFVVWDHERLLNQNGQVVTHIETVANLPFAGLYPDAGSSPLTDSYKIQVIDDVAGLQSGDVGTFNAATLTLNPVNPGHIGPPVVNLFADAAHHPLPPSIEFGTPLTVFATAIGNPSSFKIQRLGIKIQEIVDLDPLHPDPARRLQVYEQHTSGVGPGLFQSDDVMQSPSSATGVSLAYSPPDLLPPGIYYVSATAWDSAGFSRTAAAILTVTRSFGFLNVVSLQRQVSTTCDESNNDCFPEDADPFGFPCNTTKFSAVVNLINNSPDDSGFLRVRVLDVPGRAFLDQVDLSDPQFALPDIQDLAQGFVSSVAPLPGCSAQEVQICGLIPKPNQNRCDFGIGHQVFALLEECDGSAAECTPNSDLWTPIDSIKVTEGEWVKLGGFQGPGGGANQDRRGVRGNRNPFRLNAVVIVGPTTVGESTPVQFVANAILRNSAGATKTLNNVRARWAASRFAINPTTGLFRPGQVTSPTSVRITATFRYGGVTRTRALTVRVTPRASAASAAAAVNVGSDMGASSGQGGASASSSTYPSMSSGMSDEAMAGTDYALGQVSSQMAIPGDVVAARGKRRHKKSKAPAVSLSLSSPVITEGGAAILTVSAPRTDRSRPLTINYALGGSAVLNTHFVVCGTVGRVTIPAGSTTARINLSALANDLDSGGEIATVSLRPGRGYKLTRRRIQNVTIVNSPTLISIQSCPVP
jgi:hypothetical protein